MLLAAISVAGLAFGHEAAQGAVVGELGGLLGEAAAEALEAMIINARKSLRASAQVALAVAPTRWPGRPS